MRKLVEKQKGSELQLEGVLEMVETTKPKMIEATQFTKVEYEAGKASGFAIPNEFRKAAMQKLAGMEKDPKSDLNLNQGGINNIRRVRVLKNSTVQGEAAWDQKNISLVFDLLSAAKNVGLAVPKPVFVPKVEPLFVLIEVSSASPEFANKVLELAKVEGQKATGPLTAAALVSLVVPKSKGPYLDKKKPNNGKRPDQPVVQNKPQTPSQN